MMANSRRSLSFDFVSHQNTPSYSIGGGPSTALNPPVTESDAVKPFEDALKWELGASVLLAIITTIAVVAIVYAIIDCLERTGTAMGSYSQLSTSDNSKSAMCSRSSDSIAVSIQQEFPQFSISQAKDLTMEGFISMITKEKPIRFWPEQLEELTEGYNTVLGSGGFGVVFKGKFPNGMPVAVKVLNNNMDKHVEQQFMADVGTIGRTYHFNLVRLYGFCFTPDLKALVYEYMENGSLDRFLFTENREVEWEKLHEIAIGAAKGIAYLHEECQQRIIHYDIKPENVLLDENMNPKVADFGLAKLCNRESSSVPITGMRGTPGYAAPEIWKGNPASHKCDVYSFGMLLFEVVGRRRKFVEEADESCQWLSRRAWNMFNDGRLEDLLANYGIDENNVDKARRTLMVSFWCIQYSPDARPLMSTVVKMLEGDNEIPVPPYPFKHLDSGRYLVLQSGTEDESSTTASSVAQSSEQTYSRPLKGTLEIEPA